MIVLDASAAIEALQDSPEGHAIQEALSGGEKIISCDLLRAEAASVLRKFVLIGKISPSEAGQRLSRLMNLVDEIYPLAPLQTEALAESIRLNHSVYDMFYFILARRTQGTLFTTDSKLLKLSGQHGVECMTLVDF
ncbi:MAG: type II toxin-antitoxin system VapC family toxin [Eggerthellaceae bacterium]|nr:type II toxin-antitoxin system VapC family toxin [Eggerthellaceae bacterium]